MRKLLFGGAILVLIGAGLLTTESAECQDGSCVSVGTSCSDYVDCNMERPCKLRCVKANESDERGSCQPFKYPWDK